MKSKAKFIWLFLLPLIYVVIGCTSEKKKAADPRIIVENALASLGEINSATTHLQAKSLAPGDTIWRTHDLYEMELRNDLDTLLSARTATFHDPYFSQFAHGYDGHSAVSVYEDKEMVVVDSFRNPKFAFKTIRAPFYQRAERLLEYVLESNDSMSLTSEMRNDTLMLSVEVYDTVVEVIGTSVVYSPAMFSTHKEMGNSSKYRIYLDAQSLLPIRLDREMPHEITQTSVVQSEFNTLENPGFKLTNFYPSNYGVIEKSRIPKRSPPHAMQGRMAPGWSLLDARGDSISLAELKGKVTLLEFTSVTCGPCKLAIPFLNDLMGKYEEQDFALISIETLDRSIGALQHYQDRHGVKFPFLQSNPKIRADYNVGPTPTFMVVDRQGKITNVFQGYGQGRTDEELLRAIEDLI